jgi:serine/threonine-protein kinase
MAAEASIVWNQAGEERIPRSFGRLWLLRRLARGGMGEVYLAATTGIEGAERPCVVKIIRRDHATDKSFVARFLDEARVQAQLQHHGVAQILEASTDASGEPYVVVEHVEGRSLGEVRTRATNTGVRVDWPDAVAIGTSAAEALGHIHERTDSTGKALDIVHRDLSPQNVMIGYGGDVKLIDFGTARGENRRCHTISGVVFAKPGYVAPEVAAGISGDFRVDLYALGIMLWELLAGRRFLQGDPSEHLALVEKNERKPPPVAALVGAPLELDDVIAKLTAHHVVDRYASAKLAASDLVKLLSKAPGLPNGERGVRARIANLMYRLYPSEPAKSRAEFGSLVKAARWAAAEEAKAQAAPSSERAPAPSSPAPSPSPAAEPKADEAKERAGEVLDGNVLAGTRYRILRTIGRGAMGVVYEAEHIDLQRRVALKVMSHEEASAKVAASFRREARAIARLCHPNLVMIHDFGEAAGGRAYCAMELLRGETLEQRFLREGRVPVRDAVALGILACRGLEAAHAVGVVHCDLKPANLFLSSTGPFEDAEILEGFAGGLKILDFGIAKTTHELSESPLGQGEFAVVGTPEYMAPEQAQSSDVDGRADVYALGCVLYELCTGRLPFAANSAASLSEMKSKSTPEPMSASRALRIPARLDRVVMKALAPRPEDRYASATEFRRALEGVFAVPGRRRAASRWIGYACIASASLFALGVFATPRRLARLMPAAPAALPLSIATTATPTPALAATPTSTAAPAPTTTATAKPNPTAVVSATPTANRTTTTTATAKPSAVVAAPTARPSHLHPPTTDKKPAELVSTALAAGNIALQSGSLGDALAIHRALAKQHPDDASVQRAWAESAAAARSWSEAIEASEAWAFADSSVEPRLYLARMLAYSGRRRAAVRILENVLEAHPEADEARALLRDYRGDDAPPPVSSAQAVRTPTETP